LNFLFSTMGHNTSANPQTFTVDAEKHLNAAPIRLSVPGIETSLPVMWRDVKKIVKKKDFDKFSRPAESNKAYEAKIAAELEKYLTIGDAIHVELFGALTTIDNKSGKTIAVDQAASGAQPALVICGNLFPYHLADDVKHFVLWSRKENFTIKEVKNLVATTLDIKKKHISAYQQPDGESSVTNVLHWQIFIEASALDEGFDANTPIEISESSLAKELARLEKRKRIGRLLLIFGVAGGPHGPPSLVH